MDISMLRKPLWSGGSLYDFETGICFFDSERLESGTVLEPIREIEFAHETAHWMTEALTSIGQFLAFLKAAKGFDIVQAAAIDDDFRSMLRQRIAKGGPQSSLPVYTSWEDFEQWPSEHGELDVFLEGILLDVRADAVLCHGHSINASPMNRLAVLAHAMGRYTHWLNNYPLLNNRSYDQSALERFIEKSIQSGYFRAMPFYGGHRYTTTDLMEAVALCAEVIWAIRNSIAEIYLPERLERLRHTGYLAPIREILFGIGKLVTVESVIENIMQITIILCAALNPPLPPLESTDGGQLAWEHIFPPLRFLLFFQNVGKHAGTHLLRRSYGNVFDEDARSLQTFVYKVMDPPDRSFQVHVTENKVFDAFLNLPTGYQINEHGAWVHQGRLLTPYDLRMSAAFQFKMALYDKGIESQEEALFHPELKSVTRYCVPVLTIRTGSLDESGGLVPLNSQLLLDDELISWFLTNTGVQTAGLDFLYKPGPIDFGSYLRVFPQMDPTWMQDIRMRSETVWRSFLA